MDYDFPTIPSQYGHETEESPSIKLTRIHQEYGEECLKEIKNLTQLTQIQVELLNILSKQQHPPTKKNDEELHKKHVGRAENRSKSIRKTQVVLQKHADTQQAAMHNMLKAVRNLITASVTTRETLSEELSNGSILSPVWWNRACANSLPIVELCPHCAHALSESPVRPPTESLTEVLATWHTKRSVQDK